MPGEFIDGARGIVKGRDPDNLAAVPVGVELGGQLLRVALFSWDTGTLEWVRYTGSSLTTGDLTVSMDDVEKLLADSYWQRMYPYLYASDRPKYICKNTDIDANLTDTDWRIWKYTDADIPQIEGPRTGAINTEVVVNALGWNI